jgi:hypothetical protein
MSKKTTTVEWAKMHVSAISDEVLRTIRSMNSKQQYSGEFGLAVCGLFDLLILSARKSGMGGELWFTEHLRHTPETLALAYGVDKNLMVDGLKVLAELERITLADNVICVKNYHKYNDCDAQEELTKRKKQTAIRVAVTTLKKKWKSGVVDTEEAKEKLENWGVDVQKTFAKWNSREVEQPEQGELETPEKPRIPFKAPDSKAKAVRKTITGELRPAGC